MSMEGDYVLDMFLFLLQKYTGLSASTAHLQVNILLILSDLLSIHGSWVNKSRWKCDFTLGKASF